MTTPLASPRAPSARTTSAPGAHGLVWSVLRLHRVALWCWLLLVVAVTAAMLWAYGPGFDATIADLRARCRGNTEDCYFPGGTWLGRYDSVIYFTTLVLAHLPLLIGAWAGAALIGRELESGTAQLAWTQSVSPTRWLATKLTVPALLITAGMAVLVPVHHLMWYSGQELLWTDWSGQDGFRSNGTVTFAYALCGLAVGALAGLVVGRALPALGVAVAAVLAVVTLGNEYRMSLWPTVTVTDADALTLPDKALLLDRGVLTDEGVRIANNMACTDADGAAGLRRCLDSNKLSEIWATYHPHSHFWPLQLVETGIVLAVAALAVAAAFVLLHRRTAATGAAA
ncbi:ABC transporter permease [Streptomyces sp. NPDC057298]|uniref:ABC transporter permease n=1 Tax=Streptomyces sp. NPDC057298 TaxID=3346091 RepID=UPI003633FFEC